MAVDMLLYLSPRDQAPMMAILGGRDSPSPHAIVGMADLATKLRRLPEEVSSQESTSDRSVAFCEQDSVRWDLDQIRYVLMPRVLQRSSDQQVIDALVAFDGARRKLENAVITHKRIVVGRVLEELVKLLDQAQALYQALCEGWS